MNAPVTIGRATHIYALCDEGGVVRYVGKTVRSLKDRLGQHRCAARRGSLPVNRWLRKQHEIKKGNSRFCSRTCYQESLRGVTKPVPRECTKRGVEAAARKRRAQTHCKRGHPLSGDNLFFTSQGGRGCKECRKIHKSTYWSKAHG